MEISNIKLKIPRDEVLKRLSYKEGTTDKSKLHLIDKEIEEAYSLLDVKAAYTDFDIDVTDDTVELKGAFTVKSSTLAKRLSKCSKVTLFAVTVGDAITKKTNELVVDTIRDAIGSEAVEEAANEVNQIINQHIKLEGGKPIARYSVGYGDWNVSDQSKIIKALNVDFIKVGSSHIMEPRKSITAVIGWETS